MDPVKRQRTACIIIVLDDKGNVPLFGVPAVRRLVILAQRSGMEPLRLFGRVELVEAALADLVSPETLRQIGDLSALEQAVRDLRIAYGAKVMVIEANHVIDEPLFDLAATSLWSATPPMEAQGNETIGGPYLLEAHEVFPFLSALFFDPKSAPSASFKRIQPQGTFGLPCAIDVKGKEACEAALIASLAARVKPDDSFLSRHLSRRISRVASARIVRTALTANQITIINGAIGLAGAFFFSLTGYWQHLLGALLFLFCIIMDGADGEVARLKLQESSFGRSLDYAVDNVVHVAIFVGIALGLYRSAGHERYLLALGLLLAGFGLCALVVYRFILKRTPGELERSPLVIRLMALLLVNRDFAYLIVLFALIDHLNWFLWATAFGTYLFALALWLVVLSERRAHKSSGVERSGNVAGT